MPNLWPPPPQKSGNRLESVVTLKVFVSALGINAELDGQRKSLS